MSDEDIQNLSQLQLLESLDLGHRKIKKEESKQDDFENVINNLLTKVDNRIDKIKKLSNNEYNIKPFDMDSNSEHNSSKVNEAKNLKNNKNNFNNINNKNYLEDLNNNNNGNPSINNNFYNNNIPKVSNNLINSQNSERKNNLLNSNNNFNIFEENKNNDDNDKNDNNNGNDLLKNSKNNDIINQNNKNNISDEFILDDIPELDQQTNEDKPINDNNDFRSNNIGNNNININIKLSQNGESNKSNGNMNQDENFKIDANEIELNENSIDKEEENNKLLEEERLRKEKEDEEERIRKEKEEEEERIRKEKEEEEERIRREKEEEERLQKEKEEEEERIRKEKEEEEERKKKEEEKLNKENEENNRFDIEKVEESNNSNNNSLNSVRKDLNNIEENNKGENEEYQVKEKKEQKKDDMDFEIDEIEILSKNSINENQNEKEPEKQNKVSDKKSEDGNDSKYKIEVIKESKMSQDSKKSEDKKSIEDEDKKSKEDENKRSRAKEDEISEKEEDEISEKKEEKKDKKVEKQKDIKLKNSNNKDLRNNSMPQNNKHKSHPDKKEIKRSLTQKCTQIKTNITKTIEKSDESQIDVSKVKDFETLKNLVQDEVALNELIPDFKEKILDKDDEDNIKAREFYITKEKFVASNIKECEDLSLYASDYEKFHSDLMKNIYEEKGLSNLPKHENNFEEVIFHESKVDLMNSPIGGVENIDSFFQKYFLTNNKKIIEISNKNFAKWRRILGDGNSFYRILMFGMFEEYILTSNENELNYLIAEIITDEYIELYKKNNIDYNTCFILLSAILDLVKEKNTIKAYEIFLKSYTLKDRSFDKMLIVYLKHVIAIYIDKLKEIVDKKHINTDNNYFNSYMIESPNIEPSMLIICIIPYLFNISMTLFSLNGDLLKPNNTSISFIDPEEKEIPVINFGYFFSSYYKLYSSEFEEINNFELNLMENNCKQLTYVFKDEKPCEKCVKKTTYILFIEKKFIICKNCLEDHLSYACNFRADAFKQNGFIGLEYYTRPIHLCDNYYINDLEVIELLESFNILSALCQKYNERMCDNCKEKKETEDLFDLNCGCCFCGECIEDLVSKLTDGIKFLIPFEKKKITSVQCICHNQLDVDTLLKHIKYDQNDEKDASERLKNYINSLCLICTKNVREEDNMEERKYSNLTTKYKTIKLKKNIRNERANGIEYMEIEHLICLSCYLKYMKNQKIESEEEEEEEEDEEDKKKVIDLESGKISCSICCRKHDLDPKIMNEGGCCSGGCNTF